MAKYQSGTGLEKGKRTTGILMKVADVEGLNRGPGVYRLYEEEGGDVHFIGRDDTDLKTHLEGLDWKCPVCKTPVSFIECYNCAFDEVAFRYECIEFHSYSGLCNRDHPKAPEGKNLTCPRCRVAS